LESSTFTLVTRSNRSPNVMVTFAGRARTTEPAFGVVDAMPEWAMAAGAAMSATADAVSAMSRNLIDCPFVPDGEIRRGRAGLSWESRG
jgi:hypothetical protein